MGVAFKKYNAPVTNTVFLTQKYLKNLLFLLNVFHLQFYNQKVFFIPNSFCKLNVRAFFVLNISSKATQMSLVSCKVIVPHLIGN